MQHTFKKLPQSQVEFEITVTPADYQKDMEAAATRLSERAAIKGFRPGKAPFAIVKEQMGELKILEEAMQSIVEKNFFNAVTAEKLSTIGMPEITISKVAPGNDFVFKAVVALLPVVKLADLKDVKVEKKNKKIEAKDVDSVLHDLGKMQSKEVIKNGAATKEDKVVVTMNMFLDKVPVEGGQATNHQVYLKEPHYIPGFAEQLVGAKKDETKKFTLKFPEQHYQKHLSGKNIDFEVTIKDVFEIQFPDLNDEFAVKLGQKDMAALREILEKNLAHEAEHKEDQRLEAAILEQLVEKSQFDEIPEVLLRSEKNKMFQELKNSLSEQGIEMEKYLADLKKTEEEIFKDFTERATTRAKASLISRQVALDNKITVSEPEIEAEAEMIKAAYNNDPKVIEALKRHEVRDTLAMTVQNRKVVEWLKEQVLGKEAVHKCGHSHEHDHGEKECDCECENGKCDDKCCEGECECEKKEEKKTSKKKAVKKTK